MAKPRPDPCMFCEELPCVCSKPAKKMVQKRVSQPAKNVIKAAQEKLPDASSQMKALSVQEEIDPEIKQAIWVLRDAGMLHPVEKRQLHKPENMRRAAQWRTRRHSEQTP